MMKPTNQSKKSTNIRSINQSISLLHKNRSKQTKSKKSNKQSINQSINQSNIDESDDRVNDETFLSKKRKSETTNKQSDQSLNQSMDQSNQQSTRSKKRKFESSNQRSRSTNQSNDSSVEDMRKELNQLKEMLIQENQATRNMIDFKLNLLQHTRTSNATIGKQFVEQGATHPVFDQQKNRPHVEGFVSDGRSLDIVRISSMFQFEHTGRLPFEIHPNNTAFRLFIQLLTSSKTILGYRAPVWTPKVFFVALPSASEENAEITATINQFELLRAGFLFPRASSVYRALCCVHGEDDEDVVVKLYPDATTTVPEIEHLKRLSEKCLSIPTLVASGKYPSAESYMFMITKPVGKHLPISGDVNFSTKSMKKFFFDVCCAIQYAYQNCDNLLHRDISYGNIVYKNQQAYLIDWHVALSEHAVSPETEITGTLLFCSQHVTMNRHNPHAHRLADDLESLFYVIMYVVNNGNLPWENMMSLTAVFWGKRLHMNDDLIFNSFLEPCKDQSLRDLLLKLRCLLQRCGSLGDFEVLSQFTTY